MKKLLLVCVAFFLLMSTSVVSAQSGNQKTEEGYVDPVTGNTIAAAFVIGPDGSLQEIPLEDFVADLEKGRKIESEMQKIKSKGNGDDSAGDNTQPYDYYYYDYDESGNYVYTSSSYRQASASIKCNSSVPCPITTTYSNTISASFSANVDTTIKKDAVKAAVGFSYVQSSTRSNSYTMSVPVNRQAFIGFYPKYNYSYGTLKYMHQQGAYQYFVSSESASVSSPKEINYDEPDGVYTLIYEN
jgi:hypothetical protein